jgi:hypothetical protein
MMNLFRKLDRMAERWIDTLDGDLNQPVVRAITGEVFTHDTADSYTAAHSALSHQLADGQAENAAHFTSDAVDETLNPPLSIPGVPKASILTQVT